MIFSIDIGILEYPYIIELKGIDSFYRASLIVTKMELVNEMRPDFSKLFARIYSIFSGVHFKVLWLNLLFLSSVDGCIY
ncbi:MAG: succinyl-CoA synthetase beta subunit [Psychroserpens sp.]